MEFMLQPAVYATGDSNSLLDMLDHMWVKKHTPGEGTLYIISGFTNYNGGVRFYPVFSDVEAALHLEPEETARMQFSWDGLLKGLFSQGWDIYRLEQADIAARRGPGWTLLYDELHDTVKLDDSQLVSMVVLLSHSDTARIQAPPATNAGKGTQYFWLCKDSFDFFPPLTEPAGHEKHLFLRHQPLLRGPG